MNLDRRLNHQVAQSPLHGRLVYRRNVAVLLKSGLEMTKSTM